ncbi:hypothetical protein FRC08_000205 [Ceratobasidium sp. 394]|nr:hypothetical protein FRC08_000205 [Ceratobasidium sp. 394]
MPHVPLSPPWLRAPSKPLSAVPATLGLCADHIAVPRFKAATAPPSDLQKISGLGSKIDKDELDDEENTKGSDDGSEGGSNSDERGRSDEEKGLDEEEDELDEEINEKPGKYLFEPELELEHVECEIRMMRTIPKSCSQCATFKI